MFTDFHRVYLYLNIPHGNGNISLINISEKDVIKFETQFLQHIYNILGELLAKFEKIDKLMC